MTKRPLGIIAAVLAIIWSSAALAVYQETSVTVTDKGTPVPEQTVTLTVKEKDPQRPQKPKIKRVVKHKTNRDGKIVVKYDDKENRPDIIVDIELRTSDGGTRVMRDVAIATLIAPDQLPPSNENEPPVKPTVAPSDADHAPVVSDPPPEKLSCPSCAATEP